MIPRKLILVDGNGVMYRAYFGIPALSTSSGRPTNAVLGFIRILRKLRTAMHPTHWMVVFDGGISAARLKMLESYKAQRPPMPDLLAKQFTDVHEYLDRGSITRLRIEGEEADDVLATVAAKASTRGAQVLIVTNDKDFYQLVNEQVRIVPGSDVTQVINSQHVREKTGVAPDKMVEWLALVGDSSDNIPGVPAVGAKTAARLLEKYGTLDNLWMNLDMVMPQRIRNALQTSRDIIARNIGLISLRQDIDCQLDWQMMAVKPEQPERLIPFFEKLELHSLAKKIKGQ